MNKKFLLLGLCALILAGCATSTYYTSYTYSRFPVKDTAYKVSVYPDAQSIGTANPYYIIGKVSIEGLAGSGVNPATLTNEAMAYARKKGADAIINAKTRAYYYYYGDEMFRFTGDLIVYAPAASK